VVAGVEFDGLAELLTVHVCQQCSDSNLVVGSDLRSGLEVLCGKQLVAFSLECVGHDYTKMCKSKGVSKKRNNQSMKCH
jgi:hypothetical protein